MNIISLLLVLGGGFLSGFINTLASSGSAVTLPLLIFLGLPANIANGTNRVALFAGSIAAILTFQKAKAIDWKNGLIIAIPVVLGTLTGAQIATVLDAKAMGLAIVAAVILAFIMLLANPKRLLKESPALTPLNFWKLLIFFLVGVWAGFIVLDSATYLLMALILAVGYDLIKANAIKSLALFFVSLVSIVVFTEHREINWQWGSLLALGSIFGSWVGGLLATKPWAKIWVFRLLLVVIVAEIIQMLFKYHIL